MKTQFTHCSTMKHLKNLISTLTSPQPSPLPSRERRGRTKANAWACWVCLVSLVTYLPLTTNAAQTFSVSDGWVFLTDQPTPDYPYVLEVNAWPVGKSSQYAQDFS